MGLQIRRSFKVGRSSRANLSHRGVSLSQRSGPVTVNSRGRVSVRLGRGVSWSFRLFK